jgi:CelD/BcsL family acetyltransferase involved in cellulose biosynthesis
MAIVYTIDPMEDPRWPRLLAEHDLATLFHSREWLSALQRTYGYSASVVTTCAPGENLTNGLVYCRVESRITGKRMISVPFADHCAPLIETAKTLNALVSQLGREVDEKREGYLELRSHGGRDEQGAGVARSAAFCLHRLDLGPSIADLFHEFHRNCIRRKIARAERESLTYEEGMSQELLRKFYWLTVLTRRRQHIPPQPLSWFENLLSCFSERAKLRVASKDGQLAAAILTIRYKNSMTYKYACSDPQFHHAGPMQLLIWKAIQEAKEGGLSEFDMGRTEWSNDGLLTFKDRWGCRRSTLEYFRYPAPAARSLAEGIPSVIAKRMFSLAPRRVLTAAGTILYRHIA